MVDMLATNYLTAGADNDVYDWVTNIVGVPWGAHASISHIPAEAASHISILLYDIDDDNSTSGGVIGFYWAKDNYLKTALPSSNGCLMFYLDAVLLATPEGETWESTDYWPQDLVSCLAHEFQHMVNYYQKRMVHAGSSSQTWLNELASMACEDLLATKLQVDGPRGVFYADGTAGGSDNTQGRLPLYVFWPEAPVTSWWSGSSALISYSMNYAFGAYLMRNFGGANFIRNLVQNEFTDTRAVTEALTTGGYDEDFSSVLRKFGISTLLSDSTTPPGTKQQYNFGGYVTDNLGGVDFSLGSINMYNYSYSGYVGPYLYEGDDMYWLYETSNTFSEMGWGLTGLVTRSIHVPPGVDTTIVVKAR